MPPRGMTSNGQRSASSSRSRADFGGNDLPGVSASGPQAVVFDLFGTLVSYPPGARHVRAMAERLGIAFEVLHPLYRRTRPLRDAGELDVRGALWSCCEKIGVRPSDEQIEAACADLVAFFRDVLTPREDAVSMLQTLRERGLRLGVLSDANLEVASIWSTSTLAGRVDAAVFSSEERVLKPDPALYRAVCDRLGVVAGECLYVGNGDGDELAGALSAGMRAVLFTAPGEFPGREAADWRGRRISHLGEVIDLVGRPGRRAPDTVEPA